MATRASQGWGWLPAIALVMAVGLLMVSLADYGGRNSAWWGDLLFWVGVITIFAPVAFRLLTTGASRSERIALLALLGLSLYLVKMLQNPLAFGYHDELGFWRSVNDTLRTGRLFIANPLNSVYPVYPALIICTVTLVKLSGLSIFLAGAITIGVARLLLILSLFLLYEHISQSARISSLAVLIYAANPNFIFFGAQFSYESLALPLAVFVLFLVVWQTRARANTRVALTAVVIAALLALVVAHHLAMLATILILVALAVGEMVFYRRTGAQRSVAWLFALIGLAAGALWALTVATPIAGYLLPVLANAIQQFLLFLSGAGVGKTLFSTNVGSTRPLWEILVSAGSVALLLAGLPVAIWALKKRRWIPGIFALMLLAIAYAPALALRFTRAGTETSSRSSEYIFIGLGLVLVAGLTRLRTSRWRWIAWWGTPPLGALLGRVYAGALLTIIFVGGVLLATAPYGRLPGPYLVGADWRSITPEGLSAARWFDIYLGPNNRILTDESNQLLLGSFGAQNPVDGMIQGMPLPHVLFSTVFDTEDKNIIRHDRIHYLVIDSRLTTGLPLVGIYMEGDEPNARQHTAPLPMAAVTKYNSVSTLSRIYDSGSIVIYDSSNLSATF